ncbi:hypothetical protein HDU86_006689 [Geranomyces michiganensis]|nr:hypothetical protein HDU86_006689 [Geranomyces michiganensis]
MMSSDAEALAREADSEINAAFRRMAIGVKRSASSLSHPAADQRTDSPVKNASPALRGVGPTAVKEYTSFLDSDGTIRKEEEGGGNVDDNDDGDNVQLAARCLQPGIAPGAELGESDTEAFYFPEHSPISTSPCHTQTSVNDPNQNDGEIAPSPAGTDFTSASTTPTGNRRTVFPNESFATTNVSTAHDENDGYAGHTVDGSVTGTLAQHAPAPALTATTTRSSAGNSRRGTPRRNSINQYYPTPFMMPQQYPPQYYLPVSMGNQHLGQMANGAGSGGVPMSPPSIMSPPFGLTSPIQMYGLPMGMPPPPPPPSQGQAPPGLGHQQQQQSHIQQQGSQQSQPMDMPMGMPMVPMGMNMAHFPNQPVPMFHQVSLELCKLDGPQDLAERFYSTH